MLYGPAALRSKVLAGRGFGAGSNLVQLVGRWRHEEPLIIFGGVEDTGTNRGRRSGMSGNYQNWNLDGPGGLNESAAAVAAGLNEAYAAVQTTQAESHDFFVTHGAAASPGHQVGEAGRMGDPDPTLDSAD
jgi:hypothetical protein